MNFSKFVILFSPNICLDWHASISEILQAEVVTDLGQYLGLLSHLTKNKGCDLRILKEKV